MEYVFLLNPYNNIGLSFLQYHSCSNNNKHFILPLAFDHNIKYVELFDKINVSKTYLNTCIGSGARIVSEHLRPMKHIHVVFIQEVNTKIEMDVYHRLHFNRLSFLTKLMGILNVTITYYLPNKPYLEKILEKHEVLLERIDYLINSTKYYFKSTGIDIDSMTKYYDDTDVISNNSKFDDDNSELIIDGNSEITI